VSEGPTLSQWTVAEEDVGQRTDVFVSARLKDHSRSQVGRAIQDGRVTVNGAPPSKAGVRLRLDDVVTFTSEPPRAVVPEAQDLPLGLVHVDDWLVVVDKPPGMVVHPSAGHPDGTMVNALLHHIGELSDVGPAERPGIVHRLDKDTSGLLVVARDAATHRALSAALAARDVHRRYIAVLLGRRFDDQGTIETLFGRHPRERLKMSGRVPVGKRACTHWRVLARSDALVLVEIALDTGRTHQIRVHMSEAGHPVIADALYGRQPPRGGGGRLAFEHGAVRKMPRQALHAAVLAFAHPQTGQSVRFAAPLPSDMATLIERVFGADGLEAVAAVLEAPVA
jgi:23S rRNA pseudouridine1911/1915/1917 synthase